MNNSKIDKAKQALDKAREAYQNARRVCKKALDDLEKALDAKDACDKANLALQQPAIVNKHYKVVACGMVEITHDSCSTSSHVSIYDNRITERNTKAEADPFTQIAAGSYVEMEDDVVLEVYLELYNNNLVVREAKNKINDKAVFTPELVQAIAERLCYGWNVAGCKLEIDVIQRLVANCLVETSPF